jgi:hypothetical protein
MAGKTFPGIGDLEDEVPPLDLADAADSSSNSQSHYSGPTVVDDAKVEQGLKKLRSLDLPLGPLTGIHQAIVDVLTDPARVTPAIPVPADLLMPEITIDPSRGTSVGRSVSGPVVGQQTTQPFDDRALRGTMFGHGVHLPDLEEARRAMLVETSKALAVVERGVPTTNEITVFQPGTYPQRAEIPLGREPSPPRPSRFQPQDTPIALRTVSSHRNLIIRGGAAGACIVAIVVAALLWVRSNDEADLNARTPAAIPAPRPPRAVEPPKAVEPPRAVEVQPIAAPPAPLPPTPARQAAAAPPAPEAPAAKVPSPVVARRSAARSAGEDALASPAATTAETKSARPSSPAESTAERPHAASTRADRHHSAASSETADEGIAKPEEGRKPAKAEKPDKPEAPTRSSRAKRPVEEDPDATMAPSIE